MKKKFTIAEKGETRITFMERIQGLAEACYDILSLNEDITYKYSELIRQAKSNYKLAQDLDYPMVRDMVEEKILEMSSFVFTYGNPKIQVWIKTYQYVPQLWEMPQDLIEMIESWADLQPNRSVKTKLFPKIPIPHLVHNDQSGDHDVIKLYFPKGINVKIGINESNTYKINMGFKAVILPL